MADGRLAQAEQGDDVARADLAGHGAANGPLVQQELHDAEANGVAKRLEGIGVGEEGLFIHGRIILKNLNVSM